MKTPEKNLPVHLPGDAYWIGTNIHRLRKRLKLARKTLARSARIAPRRLRDIEDAADSSNLRLRTLGVIAGVLGVETVDLFKRVPEEGFEV